MTGETQMDQVFDSSHYCVQEENSLSFPYSVYIPFLSLLYFDRFIFHKVFCYSNSHRAILLFCKTIYSMLCVNRTYSIPSFISALCLMFGSFCCFSIHNPSQLGSTLEFVQRCAFFPQWLGLTFSMIWTCRDSDSQKNENSNICY